MKESVAKKYVKTDAGYRKPKISFLVSGVYLTDRSLHIKARAIRLQVAVLRLRSRRKDEQLLRFQNKRRTGDDCESKL